MMDLDFQHIDIEENKYIMPTLDILEHKIKQELPEESNIKIETPDNLDEIEFKNCNVKEEITDEICQDEDPLKVDELKDKIHDYNNQFSCDKLLKFSCHKCNKKYTTKFNLKEHERKVHQGKLYHCKNINCQQIFEDKNSLSTHVLNVHDNKEFQCEICGKDFIRKSTLKEHKANVHEGQKFTCDKCFKSFTQQSKLACCKTLCLLRSSWHLNVLDVCLSHHSRPMSW